MTKVEQRIAIQEFVKNWTGKGYEKGQSQPFWIQLLRCLGVKNSEQYISFEDQVHLDHTSFIDGYIDKTKVMIEQKGLGKSLKLAIKQSDGSLLTPFQQAKRYSTELPYSKRPRWIVTSNFEEFYIYDMEKPHGEPEIIKLENLEKEYYRLSFLLDSDDSHIRKEMEISIKAGDIVGLIYEALLKQYKNPECEETLKSLNKLCVRLVFCLYAEDAGIFGEHDMFLDYMKQFETKHFRKALIDLFKVLNTKIEDRDPYLEEELAKFPYVNGGLFEDDGIEIPNFTDEIRELLLIKASANFDWSEISPTIFGAVFESTLNPETRRKGGMHYTSIENIHKVIDPLFMNDLNKEFEEIKSYKLEKTRNQKFKDFQEKLANLTFLDPACGSGNFLTETYLSLRKLENKILLELSKGQITLGAITNPIKVTIQQFYGIEINDFAVTVAKTALWIAESQMMKQTENIVHMDLDFLPLKTYTNIIEGNALKINWEDVVPKEKLNYIMGNPPFVGAMWSKGHQREDIELVFPECEKPGQVDYVSGWYVKSAKYMQDTNIKSALVSTNSICQGQQVYLLWKPMIEKFGIKIDFAHRTFRWDSEATLKAHVHCVIVGFSSKTTTTIKRIYDNNKYTIVEHINAYLLAQNDLFISNTSMPICKVSPMHMGVMARDGGNLILSKEEYEEYIKKEPQGSKFIHKYMMGREFINNIDRYCFWLVNANPTDLKKCPILLERIEKVKEERLKSPAKETQKLAETPTLFAQLAQPSKDFLAFPKVSSEKRRYIPIGFLNKDVIVGDKIYVVENATLYNFGILTSNIHNAWMRAVCGRLKSDYSYSNTIVYNNFPWCKPTDTQKEKIEKTAQGILDARALYPKCSLADLYDELTMPPELRKAHQQNDKAVMDAYGFYYKENGSTHWFTETETVSKLMEMYHDLTKSN